MNVSPHAGSDLPADGSSVRRGNELRNALSGVLSQPVAGPSLALLVLVAVFSTATSTFLNVGNLSLIFQQSVVVGTLALGQTLIILIAGIDLANAATMVLATVIIGDFASQGHALLGFGLGAVACLVSGAVNGVAMTRFRLPPFIATLGLFTIITAGARLYSNSRSFPISSDWLMLMGSGPTYGLVTFSYGSMMWIGLTLVMSYVLNQTAWGAHVYAVGNSPIAARLNGVYVHRVVFSIYTLAGFFYFIAAWQALGRTPIADPSGYQNASLDSITAVVIGGTSMFGGRGGVTGTFVGALIVSVLKNGLTQAGIDSLYQQIATGILVILAVGWDQYFRRGRPS